MRNSIVCLMLLFILSQQCSAQKAGYKEIIIGKNINDTSLDKYRIKISNTDESVHAIFEGSTNSFCNFPVKGIKIFTDKKGIINLIEVYFKEIVFPDYKVFSAVFQQIVTCMTDVIGNFEYSNSGNKKLEEELQVFWHFDKENTTVILSSQDVALNEKDVTRFFVVTWRPFKTKSLW